MWDSDAEDDSQPKSTSANTKPPLPTTSQNNDRRNHNDAQNGNDSPKQKEAPKPEEPK
jgi:hypothetical protein